MVIEKALNEFIKLKHLIGKYFGVTIYGDFDDKRHVKAWAINGGELSWNESEEYDGEEWCYVEEICGDNVRDKGDFTLVQYDNGCGDLIFAIFKNKNKINN